MKNKEHGAVFCQSLRDFPCPVTLGKNMPSFGLLRYKQGLRFFPIDDEGFTLRGGKRRLLYKGRRKSHRFTILGDTAFEYDCILEREPVSNVISLHMEGAENFDFFRQPDFVSEPFLKGSYAVYKKETFVGEGTGKLCHIHRPEIIDAKGRRCWGDLAVVGKELRITIPEWWLSEAKYPVVVDPTVGTATVGSQTNWVTVSDNGINDYCLIAALGVNRFAVPETYNGTVTAYVYAYSRGYMGQCKPVLYSDNNDVPLTRLSSNEGIFDIEIRPNTKPAGWRSTSYNIVSNILSGSYIWYGLSACQFEPIFDFGAKLYWYSYDNNTANLPATFPLYWNGRFYDYKVSMYFTYSTGQNYVYTITQGVNITDSKILTADYKRITEQNVQAVTTINKLQTIYRNIQEAMKSIDNLFIPVLIVRKIYDAVKVSDILKQLRTIFIGLFEILYIESKAKSGRVYFAKISDTVFAAGVMFRTLFMFVRIISKVFISDNLLKRFLKSKTEVKLKSCVIREIVLESRIN